MNEQIKRVEDGEERWGVASSRLTQWHRGETLTRRILALSGRGHHIRRIRWRVVQY